MSENTFKKSVRQSLDKVLDTLILTEKTIPLFSLIYAAITPQISKSKKHK